MGYSDRVARAFEFAAEKHRSQLRKGTQIPYLTHLMAVSASVGESGGDEDQVIAALLHDCMEEQGVTASELSAMFGPRVAFIVEGCTDTTYFPKPPWRERKEKYIAHLKNAPPDIKLVSAADKLHNVRSILRDLRAHGESTWSRFSAGPSEILWYYNEVIRALKTGWAHPLIDEIEEVVLQIPV